jgi:hypothetical protein
MTVTASTKHPGSSRPFVQSSTQTLPTEVTPGKVQSVLPYLPTGSLDLPSALQGTQGRGSGGWGQAHCYSSLPLWLSWLETCNKKDTHQFVE